MGQLSKQVGKRIKQIRELRGIKQFVLAEKLNMEPSNLTRIESGLQLPKEENLVKIAQLLDVEVKDLFDFPPSIQKNIVLPQIVSMIENLPADKVRFIYDFIKLYRMQK